MTTPLPTLTNRQRLARLDKMIAEKRILRDTWVSTSRRGIERACLLAALSPEVAHGGVVHGPSKCPADLMPRWFAEITPELDDRISKNWWPEFLRMYAKTLRRVHRLTEKKLWTQDDWRRQDHLARAWALTNLVQDEHKPWIVPTAAAARVIRKVIAYHQRVATRRGIKTSVLESERRYLLRLASKFVTKHGGKRPQITCGDVVAAKISIAPLKSNHLGHVMWRIGCYFHDHNLSQQAAQDAWDNLAKSILGAMNKRCEELEKKS